MKYHATDNFLGKSLLVHKGTASRPARPFYWMVRNDRSRYQTFHETLPKTEVQGGHGLPDR